MKEAAYLQEALGMQGSPARYPCLHYQLLSEVWEEVDPGSIPSTQVHCMHLSIPGLALPSYQVLNHSSGCDLAFYYTLLGLSGWHPVLQAHHLHHTTWCYTQAS